MRAKVCGVGGSTAMPRMASGSTTMVAPPAVVVTTATRRPPRAARGGPARARTSGKPSISPSSVSTRAMPHSARNMPAMSSSPASAPVCETASSRAAAERPSL